MNMIMKQLNFKIVLLFLTIYVCPHRTLAQKDTLLYRTLIQDSILIPQKSQATIEGMPFPVPAASTRMPVPGSCCL